MTNQITPYQPDDLQQSLAITVQELNQTHAQALRDGTYDHRHIQAMAILFEISRAQKNIARLSNHQLVLMHYAFINVMYAVLGFDSMEEYLDSCGIDLHESRLNNLYNMAVNIIPWCEAYEVSVNNQPVDVWWFVREIEGKSIASRCRNAVSTLLNIIKDPVVNTPLKKQAIAQILSWIEDPKITNQELRDAFSSGGIPEFGYQAWITASDNPDESTVYVQMSLTPKQYDFLRKRLIAATRKQTTTYNKPAIIIGDDGSVTLNPDCFVDIQAFMEGKEKLW